jgi:uncharacterized coiled-coil protein SlyX
MNGENQKPENKKYISKREILDLENKIKSLNETLEFKENELKNHLEKINLLEDKLKKRNQNIINSHKKNPETLKLAQKRYYIKKRLEKGLNCRMTAEEIENLYS